MDDLGRLRGGFLLTPNQLREIESRPYLPPEVMDELAHGRSPNVLPESQVLDEIDRLVNESVARGPRDDYNVNRYPKCAHCPHDWHGILCDKCACLGELEDPE